ncbi:MAG: hypothetical protein QNJ18_09480 [Xenococcaceae cyanobacterium MO_167.B52]|nr:hypothetical protein [Xenococcaceae cyanobacterium MO_167.B52]
MGRKKLNRSVLQARVDKETPNKLKTMALKLGFQYGADGNTGALLDALANLPVDKVKELIVNEEISNHG